LKSGSVRGLIATSELILHQEVGYEFYSTTVPPEQDEGNCGSKDNKERERRDRHQSGNTRWEGHITKEGNSLLRWILIQVVHQVVRYPGLRSILIKLS
ncbi:MAG: transposase, partial [Proteobacteria bacterium]|nr:transposase [Pseudomonadota bacterium]